MITALDRQAKYTKSQIRAMCSVLSRDMKNLREALNTNNWEEIYRFAQNVAASAVELEEVTETNHYYYR